MMNDTVFINERKVELAAKTAHNVNTALCKMYGHPHCGNWDEAPQWQKDSCLAGVEFHLKNPNATPEDSHKSWLEHKEKDGWVYGEVKDVEKKTHPCMIPYEELPIEQRVKDYLFKAIMDSIL